MESASVSLAACPIPQNALTIDEIASKLPRNQYFFTPSTGEGGLEGSLYLLGSFAQVGKRGPQRIR
jgi:hypothetical protein